MTTAIYVMSTERFSGKTALCIGLIHWLQRKGFSAGYMKPISTTDRGVSDARVDEDAVFIKSALGQIDPLEAIVPLFLTDQETKTILERPHHQALETRLVDAYQVITKNNDAVVLEGGTSLREGWIIDLAPHRITGLLSARALVVVPYLNLLQVVDDMLASQSLMGDLMLGGVVNSVPQHLVGLVQEKLRPFVELRGIPILAVIPRKKALLSVSIAELVNELNGEVLCCQAAGDELVEAVMVGAMSAESALSHFRRGVNKAVITGGDRPDIQLAALETSTRCLILTGNLRPSPLIIGLAEERGIPIIMTRHDTLKAIECVESFFGKTRFHQPKKIDYFEALLEDHMDFKALSKALGI
ncbi:MAG TPA: phosphotransacetylase family protein [Syntrophorhabdaceae bacterium]|nr:phosphotransacetylase family protein [Syntrophorhabdaceae bacterium]